MAQNQSWLHVGRGFPEVCRKKVCMRAHSTGPKHTGCVSHVYIVPFSAFCAYTPSVFSSTKCVHFLRAISSTEEFRPLPTASSTTGGPIILIAVGKGKGWGQVMRGFKIFSLHIPLLLTKEQNNLSWISCLLTSICYSHITGTNCTYLSIICQRPRSSSTCKLSEHVVSIHNPAYIS